VSVSYLAGAGHGHPDEAARDLTVSLDEIVREARRMLAAPLEDEFALMLPRTSANGTRTGGGWWCATGTPCRGRSPRRPVWSRWPGEFIRQVRAAEATDPPAPAGPNKIHDDAAAVLFSAGFRRPNRSSRGRMTRPYDALAPLGVRDQPQVSRVVVSKTLARSV
jgi:hypothetical protein